MKKLNIVKRVFLSLVVLLNLGCSKDEYYGYIEIEADGDVYSVENYVYIDSNNLDDINSSIQDRLTRYDYSTYYKTDNQIDGDIYNFLIVIPIKSKLNLKQEMSKVKTSKEFIIRSKLANQYAFIPTYNNIEQDEDGYFHYKFYTDSKILAKYYYLNDIQDSTLYIYYSESDFDKDIQITSNKLTIPAEEFEVMLEKLGISHDRLSFQPEGY